MKIKKSQLKQIIKEELENIEEIFGFGEDDIVDRYKQAKNKNRETEFYNSLSDEEKDELWPQLDKLSQSMNDRKRFRAEKREADNTPDESGITPARRREIGQEVDDETQAYHDRGEQQRQGQAQLRHRQGREKEADQRRSDFDDPAARSKRQKDRRDDRRRQTRDDYGYGMEELKLHDLIKQVLAEIKD
jgi:hypothetical protein